MLSELGTVAKVRLLLSNFLLLVNVLLQLVSGALRCGESLSAPAETARSRLVAFPHNLGKDNANILSEKDLQDVLL